jgi:threonine synthase
MHVKNARGPALAAVLDLLREPASGNFGNLSAGLLARALGLPIAALVAATNANTTVPDYLDTGTYRPRPSTPTLSNAMDVGSPTTGNASSTPSRGTWTP